MRIKICGITSLSEARLAEAEGAHALGLLVGRLHAAADFLEPEQARELALALSPFVVAVLVTHRQDPEEVVALAAQVPTAVAQLHSDLGPAELKDLRARLLPRKILGLVSVEDDSALDRAREIEPFVDGIVLDSRDRATDRVGGTGRVHDWSISARIVAASRVPIILAGGLTPDNVGAAIRTVQPWGVDVNSGVESADGRKDPLRVRRFMEAAR